MLKQPPKATRIPRNLRKVDSWSERLMWAWLRSHRFAGYKFRRQRPIGPYILDFFCMEAKLNIEVDGYQHGMPVRSSADSERDVHLELQGIKVLRFWSSRLRREKEMNRNTIWRTLQERAPHPQPNYCRPGIAGAHKDSSV